MTYSLIAVVNVLPQIAATALFVCGCVLLITYLVTGRWQLPGGPADLE